MKKIVMLMVAMLMATSLNAKTYMVDYSIKGFEFLEKTDLLFFSDNNDKNLVEKANDKAFTLTIQGNTSKNVLIYSRKKLKLKKDNGGDYEIFYKDESKEEFNNLHIATAENVANTFNYNLSQQRNYEVNLNKAIKHNFYKELLSININTYGLSNAVLIPTGSKYVSKLDKAIANYIKENK